MPVFFLCAIMKRMSGLGERVGFSGEMAGAMGRRSWAVGSVPGSMELSTNNWYGFIAASSVFQRFFRNRLYPFFPTVPMRERGNI